VKEVCGIFTISRQAYYKARHQQEGEKLQEEVVVELVKEIRQKLPRVGGKKLYYMLRRDISNMPIKPGRDKFFEILRNNGLLVTPTKRYVRTTQSRHRFYVYRNLIEEIIVEGPNKVFVADITYVRITEGFAYLFLVTDLYSRKIVGWYLSKNLSVEGALEALQMAMSEVKDSWRLIHHSDRGIQYCCNEYVKLLQSNKIRISMGESGNPYDNAVAERVNGILKSEFYLSVTFNSFEDARQAAEEAIYLYNNVRPHMSIGYLTPAMKYAA